MTGRRTPALVALAGLLVGAWELLVTRLCSVLFYWEAAYLALAVSMLGLAIGALLMRRGGVGPVSDHPKRNSWLLWLVMAMPVASALAWLALCRWQWAWMSGLFAGPFVLFGAISAGAFAVAGDGRQRAQIYAAEIAGALAGLVLLGPVLVGVAPMPVLGSVGLKTHLRTLVEQEGLGAHRWTQTAAARTDLVQTRHSAVWHVLTDGMFEARAVRWDGHSETFKDPVVEQLATLKRLSHAGQVGDALLLGAGAGFDVAVALQQGHGRVTAVEVNPATVAFARELDGFAGGVMTHPGVEVIVAEGRRWTERTQRRFDHVGLALMQTSPAIGRGRTHVDAHVLTIEALRTYLGKLKPGGWLAVIQNTPELAAVTLASIKSALRAHESGQIRSFAATAPLPDGTANPFLHLVMASPRPTPEGLRAIDAMATSLGVHAWHQPTSVTPPTDDRPHLYLGQPPLPMAALPALVLALLAMAGLLVGRAGKRAGNRRWLVGAFGAGGGAMALQVLVVHGGQLAIGAPLRAWTLALAAVLGMAALGGVLLQRWWRGPSGLHRSVTLAVAGGLWSMALHQSWLAGMQAPQWSVGLLALGALPAGLPFLAVMDQAGALAGEGRVLAADALGGIAGTALAMLAVATIGFTALWALIPGLFALAWIVRLP